MWNKLGLFSVGVSSLNQQRRKTLARTIYAAQKKRTFISSSLIYEKKQPLQSIKAKGILSPEEIRRSKIFSDLRGILRHLRRWPTSSMKKNRFYTFLMEEYRKGMEIDMRDKAAIRSSKQKAKDTLLMMDNLERQKEIAMLLSGEKAPQKEMVSMAAARCGLSVPKSEELEQIKLADHIDKGYSPLSKPWRPDTSSELTKKYKERVAKKIGEDKEESKK